MESSPSTPGSLRSASVQDSGVVSDRLGGLEITILATVALVMVCIALIVVVLSRCHTREKEASTNGNDSENGSTSTPMNVVTLSPKKEPEAVWQDVPNCFVPDSCSTLQRKPAGERQTSPSRGQGSPSRGQGSPSRGQGSPSRGQGSESQANRHKSTPEVGAHSQTTDVDSVFCAITPVQAHSLGGDSTLPSHGGTPVAATLPASHRNAGGTSRSKQPSPGQVSLDGPEYALHGIAADRYSRRSNSCGHRSTNPSPLSGERSPGQPSLSARSSMERGCVPIHYMSGHAGSLSPVQRSLPRGTLPPTGEQQYLTPQSPQQQLATTHMHSDANKRSPNGDVHILVNGASSPIPPARLVSTPMATTPMSQTSQPAMLYSRGQATRIADPIYSYDSLKAEVEALCKQTFGDSSNGNLSTTQRSADV